MYTKNTSVFLSSDVVIVITDIEVPKPTDQIKEQNATLEHKPRWSHS